MAETDQWVNAATWGRAPRLNELETIMWRSERHPEHSSHITSIVLLDRAPDWDRLLAGFEWASDLLPRLRERVVEPLIPLSTPAWVEDPDFDMAYHVRRTRLAGRGDDAELLTFAEEWALDPLDRGRPLWELMVLTGLSGRRAAILLKMHHAITDGLGVVQLLTMLMSQTRRHNPRKPEPAQQSAHVGVTPVSLTLTELWETATDVAGLAPRLVDTGRRALLGPRTQATRLIRYAASAARVLGNTPTAHSPLLWPRTHKMWRFGMHRWQLTELRAAAKAAGGSVNDALVAAMLGGMRRYHELHDVELAELPMAMPISIRRPDDPDGGNRFTAVMFSGPMGVADPAERIAAVREIVLALRSEPALDALTVATAPANRLPGSVGAAVIKAGSAADISVSNLPGMRWQPYICGAKVLGDYPFAPLPGVAVMATMITIAGTCCLGLNIDGSAIPDVDDFMDCMRAGVDEVLALGRT